MPYIAVKGTKDIYKEEAEAYSYVESVFSSIASLYGYHEYRTPVLEYTEVFQRSTGESSDIVRKEMYTFLDKGNRSVTLRPEFTAGIARSILENKLYASEDLPLKVFYYGPAFRYERPQLGRYRQFNQAGVECIGVNSAEFDAETIALATSILNALGFKQLKVKINSLGDEASRNAYREALKHYFGAHIDSMCEDCKQRLQLNPLRILDCKVPEDQEIVKGAPKMGDYLSEESKARFNKTLSILDDLGVDYEIDDGLVRGLDYYSEVVFEVASEYGALVGGGHYDGLLKSLGGPDLSGVGFAFGEDRLVSVMKDNNLLLNSKHGLDVYVMPIGEENVNKAMMLSEEIRHYGYAAESPLNGGKLGSFFKKAIRRGAKFALIIGGDELAQGIAQLKNLESQEQVSIKLNELEKELNHYLDGEGE